MAINNTLCFAFDKEAGKGGSDEYGHHGMLQESSKKCSDKCTWRDKCREVAKEMEPNNKGKNHKRILPDYS